MNKNDLLSIIVPIYNVEKYIHNCIKSIINQTYNNLEIILIDDGSPDNCGIICDEYAKKDARIKVLHKQNGGLSDARNAGLNIARGEYIGFVDSDDIIHKNMYHILYKVANETDCKIIQCRKAKLDVGNINVNQDVAQNYDVTLLTNIEALDNLVSGKSINSVNAVDKLYHKTIFNSLKFKKGVLHEDNFFIPFALYTADKVANVDCALYYVRTNPNGITRSRFSVRRLDAIDSYLEWLRFFEEKDLPKFYDLSVWKLLDIIRYDYSMSSRFIENKKERQRCKKYCRKHFKANYKKAIKSRHLKTKDKIAFIIFLIAPHLYNLYYRVRV